MVDAALTGRLMAMAAPGEDSGWPGRAPWRPRAGFPATRLLTAGLLASAMTGRGAAAFFVGGEPSTPGPRVTPAVDTFLVQHAVVTGDMPVAPAAAAASPAGPASPAYPPAVQLGRASRPSHGAPSVRLGPLQPSATPGP
jgi:hypothetical protein